MLSPVVLDAWLLRTLSRLPVSSREAPPSLLGPQAPSCPPEKCLHADRVGRGFQQRQPTSMRPVSGWKLRAGSSVVTRHWMAQPLMRMFSCRRPRSGRLRPSATWIWAWTRSTLQGGEAWGRGQHEAGDGRGQPWPPALTSLPLTVPRLGALQGPHEDTAAGGAAEMLAAPWVCPPAPPPTLPCALPVSLLPPDPPEVRP